MTNSTPIAVPVPLTHADAAAPAPVLGISAEAALLRRIEAGVLAEAALRQEFPWPAGASADELRAVVTDARCAQDELVDAHIDMVRWVAAMVAVRTGLDRHELVQEGMIGLLEAIPRFDPVRGNFATCALPRIRMRVKDAAVTLHGSLGLPARRARQWRHVRAVVTRLTMRLGREPDAREVARESGEALATVEALLAFEPPVTLEPDLHEQASGADASGPDPVLLRRLLRRLTLFDRLVVCHLYGVAGFPVRSYAELAAATGRSESTIRRRERAALRLMQAGDAVKLLAA